MTDDRISPETLTKLRSSAEINALQSGSKTDRELAAALIELEERRQAEAWEQPGG